MLHIAIVDDEAGVCGQIEMLIQEYAEKQKTEIEIDVLFSGEELIRFLSQRKSYDLILLDIELAELNGVAVGKIIREKFDDYATKIAYVSGKTHYAMELFQISSCSKSQVDIQEHFPLNICIILIKSLSKTFCIFKVTTERSESSPAIESMSFMGNWMMFITNYTVTSLSAFTSPI